VDRRTLIRLLAVPAAAAAAAAPLLPVRTWFDAIVGRLASGDDELLTSPNLLLPLPTYSTIDICDLIDEDALLEEWRRSSPIAQLLEREKRGQITFEACWPPAPKVMQVGDEIRITMPDGEQYTAEVSLVTVEPGPGIDSLSISAEIRPTGDSGLFD